METQKGLPTVRPHGWGRRVSHMLINPLAGVDLTAFWPHSLLDQMEASIIL